MNKAERERQKAAKATAWRQETLRQEEKGINHGHARRLGEKAINIAEQNFIPTHRIVTEEPEPLNFISPSTPGYSQEEIEADVNFYEEVKTAHEANFAEERQQRERDGTFHEYDQEKSRLAEEIIKRDLLKIMPKDVQVTIYPCSDIDDRLNHVDFVVVIERPLEDPIIFAVDATYNNREDVLRKKMLATSRIGKRFDEPYKTAEGKIRPGFDGYALRPEVSEYALKPPKRDPKTGETSGDEEYESRGARNLGFANVKYFEDEQGRRYRLTEIPKVILGIADSEIPTDLNLSINGSGQKIDTTRRRERLSYELLEQSKHIYIGAYDSYTSDLTGQDPAIGAFNGVPSERYISKAAVQRAQNLMNFMEDLAVQRANLAEGDRDRARAHQVVNQGLTALPGNQVIRSNGISEGIVSLSREMVEHRMDIIKGAAEAE